MDSALLRHIKQNINSTDSQKTGVLYPQIDPTWMAFKIQPKKVNPLPDKYFRPIRPSF